MTRMSEDQLRAITDAEMRQSVGYWSGKLANQRQKAMAYYLGEANLDLTPSEVEGRSSVVSPDVRNTIESMLPQLMVKFSGSDKVVEFEATKPGDEEKAEQATDYVNYLYYVRNSGESITYTWMKDALLSKNGIVKVWWDDRAEEKREEYRGLSDVELSQIMEEDELEIIEQKSYPDEDDAEQRQEAVEKLTQAMQQAMQAAQQNPQAAQAVMQIQQQLAGIQSQPPAMLYDITCKRVKDGGRVCVENVPPEEFLISRKAKSIETAPFVGHRVQRTLSELKSQGYKNIDQLSGDDNAMSLNMERVERLGYDDEMSYLNSDMPSGLDDSQRVLWVTECYVRVDYDGDGIAELRKVVRAGNQILENEICDCAPFVSITPIPMPHKFFGLSVADLSMEAQKIKTNILRGMLDNMYLQINGRYFAVENQVNLDDLLTSRPGGVVRMKQAGMAGRLDQGVGDSQIGLTMMEYMHGFLEDSSGWNRNSAGNNPDGLNPSVTATQANIVTNKADMRLDLIARNFAEGFRDLFRMILKLVSQYQSKEDIIRLRGKFLPVNPRDWRNGFDATLNVGLGTGSRDQQVQHLMALIQQQGMGLQVGTANPKNLFEAQKELVRALGFKSGERFFTDPAENPPKPQPNPEAMKAQAQMQVESMKMQAQQQADAQRMQMEDTQHQREMQRDIELERAKQELQARENQMTKQLEAERDVQKAQMQAEADAKRIEFERWKAQLQSDTAILIEQMRLGMKQQQMGMDMQKHADARQDAQMEESDDS